MARAFLAFKSMWVQQPAFAASLVKDLLGDLERFSGASAAPSGAAQGASAGAAGAAAAAAAGAAESIALRAMKSSAQDGRDEEGQAGQSLQPAVDASASPQKGHKAGADLAKVLGLLPCVLAILEGSWEQHPEDEGRVAGRQSNEVAYLGPV